MQYVTSRANNKTFHTIDTLKHNLSADGGHFMPDQLPVFDSDMLSELRHKSFGETVSDVLNMFFSYPLNGWDVDFCIGRNVLRMIGMNYKVAVAELWHNLDEEYDYIIRQLYSKITTAQAPDKPTVWFRTAAGIAILFGIYGEMLQNDIIHKGQVFDISLMCRDFSGPMTAIYAKQMGLPVGTVICTCEENSPVWDLIQRGSINTDIAGGDLLLNLEPLICTRLGYNEVCSYREKITKRHTYFVPEEMLEIFHNGLFCAVPGSSRAGTVINSIYRTNSYITCPKTALCYGGMQDFRARTGESRLTLLLAQELPSRYKQEIIAAIGSAPGNLDRA